MTTELGAIVEDAVEAYNEQDFDRYQELFVEDLYFCHHNRGFEFRDRGAFIEALEGFAADLVPDRRLGAATRMTCNGNVVVREQTWSGTAKSEFPGIAAEGESFSFDFCTVYIFDGDRVAEYHEYG